MDITAWEKQERAVSLTNDQWNTIVCYILSTTQHRKGERKAWESLAAEVNEDGSPRFPNAAGNAEYYAELEIELDEIVKKIER